jgi:hypothetical protein
MSLIIPSVFADAVNAKLGTSLRIGNIAFDATGMVSGVLSAGNKINFPKFDRVATVDTVTQGTALVPAAISMTGNEAELKQVGGSVRVYDKDAAQIQGAVMDNMIMQVTDAMRKQIDGDLAAAIDADAIYKQAVASGTAITNAELMSGVSLFGDDIDTESFAGVVINSRLYPSLIAMPEFTSTEKTYASIGNGFVKNGVVGFWLGVPVIVCNDNTWDSAASECKTYIAKKNALGYVFQKDILVEEERESKLLCTDIVCSSIYATKLINKDDVVVLRKTIA